MILHSLKPFASRGGKRHGSIPSGALTNLRDFIWGWWCIMKAREKINTKEEIINKLQVKVALLVKLDIEIKNLNFDERAKEEFHKIIDGSITSCELWLFSSKNYGDDIKGFCQLTMTEISLFEYHKRGLRRFLKNSGFDLVRLKINDAIGLLTDIQRNILKVLQFYSTEKERPLIEAGIERLEEDHGSDLSFVKEIFMGKASQQPKGKPTP